MSTIISGPVRVQQRRAALEHANAVRLERARLKNQIAALSFEDGCAQIAAWLIDPPEVLAGMMVTEMLCSLTRVRENRAHQICERAGVPRDRRFFGAHSTGGKHGCLPLTLRQRRALAMVLRDLAHGELLAQVQRPIL